MSLTEVFGMGPVHINTVTNDLDVVVPGMNNVSISQSNSVINRMENGELYPTYTTIAGQQIRCSWSTRDISTMLGTLGATGIPVDADGTHDGLVVYMRKRDVVGTATGSVHRSYTFAKGIIVPRSLNIAHQGNAQMNCEVLPISSDGATSMVVIADDVSSFPAVLAACLDDQYTLYSLTINSATVTGFTGLGLTFGAAARTRGAQSDVLDTVASMPSLQPTLRIDGSSPTWINTASSVCDILGEACAHANTNFVLRKRGVALTASEHIQVTLNGVVYPTTIMSTSGNGDATVSLMLTTHSADGTTSPIVLNTAYQITAP